MTSSPYGPYELGYTRATKIITKSYTIKKFGVNLLKFIVFGLQAEIRLYKVGITSNRRSACYGEFVLRLCTHRPSHAGSEFYFKFKLGIFVITCSFNVIY